MTIQGTVTHILPVQSGASKNGGEWHKYGFVLTTGGQYPKSVAIEVWKDEPDIEEGQTVTAHIDIESREHNGRWFTAVKAYKIEGDTRPAQSGSARHTPSQAPQTRYGTNSETNQAQFDDVDDGLPF